ncbi:hypothetical protein Glove_300g116 [Diversispora epigaea]|uniref:BTB domain-containing protein n=1 Tax=Diversispora epigaea TaxID=1348612 RepID=A0A397I073_9GLOM|nr:hypothetical protein Glove_300g116 [Diversispora epigaea]
MSFKFFDKLSQDFSELLNDKKDYNVIIEVDNEENKKSFTAHSVVLRYRSSYFDKELENATTNENIKTIIKPNISAQIFEIILKYIYSGIVDDTDTKTIYEVMVNANELELKELSGKLENYLIEYKASWLRTHFALIYHSIFDSNEFKGLKKFYNNIIARHPNLIFESGDFTSLQETALISILKIDDLKIEEIKIWDYVINWGLARNPTLPTDPEEWSKENFQTLKTTLQQCLPLIRYFHIPDEDVWEKVKPYKKILEKQLWNDLIQYRMFPNKPVESVILPARIISTSNLPSSVNESLSTPSLIESINESFSTPSLTKSVNESSSTPRLPSRVNELLSTPDSVSGVNKPFSTIISKEHASELSSWIDRKSKIYSLSNTPYKFQLILRGSRDGFHPKTFWKMCHGQSGTIVVVKIAGTDEIIGGYNPLAWDNLKKNAYMRTNDSFIFSLKNGNIRKSILSRVRDGSQALYYYNSDCRNIHGPDFGNCEFMMKSNVSNFTQDNECWCRCDPSYKYYYEKPIRTVNEKFSAVDYEVFKIVKKR